MEIRGGILTSTRKKPLPRYSPWFECVDKTYPAPIKLARHDGVVVVNAVVVLASPPSRSSRLYADLIW